MTRSRLLLVSFALAAVAIPGARYLHQRYEIRSLPESDLFAEGQRAQAKGDCGLASEFYRSLLKKDPRHTGGMDYLAECLETGGNFTEAVALREELLRHDGSLRQRRRLIHLYEKAGMTAKADNLQKLDEESRGEPGSSQ